jgi:hypothetical protein
MAFQALAEKETERKAEDPKYKPDSAPYGTTVVAERIMASDPNPSLRREAKAVLAHLRNEHSPFEQTGSNNSGQFKEE